MRNPPNDPLGSDSFDDTVRGTRAPERRCVLTGRSAPRDTLVRLALAPDGAVLPDALAKAPGRGAWIGGTRAELSEAIDSGKLKGALSRGFRTGAVVIPDDLPDRVEAALTRALADRLGVENRAGHLLTGSDRIDRAARSGRIEWLGHASDAGEDGSRTLDQAWRVGSDNEGGAMRGIALPLDREALSVALGRENVVHLALTDRSAAQRVSILLDRLLHFLGRGDDPLPDRAGKPRAGMMNDMSPDRRDEDTLKDYKAV